MPKSECNLIQCARMLGTAAGYLQRGARGDFLSDAKRLLLHSPDRSLVAAAALGLALGAFLRRW
jgi:hypothetical protein